MMTLAVSPSLACANSILRNSKLYKLTVMKTLKSILMIAIFATGLIACQEDDLPRPSGISTVPNSVNPIDAEFDEYRAQFKADLQDNALDNQASKDEQVPARDDSGDIDTSDGDSGEDDSDDGEIRPSKDLR